MKSSLAHLPLRIRRDLKRIVTLIRANVPRCEMVILYGNYTQKAFEEQTEWEENGVRISFRRALDLVVVTTGVVGDNIFGQLDRVEEEYLESENPESERFVPLLLSHEDIEVLNHRLSEGHYFYNLLKREGILLYTGNRVALSRLRKKTDFCEIAKQARFYLESWMLNSRDFFEGAHYYHDQEFYPKTCYLLSQSCEVLCTAIQLSFTLRRPKRQRLDRLIKTTLRFAGPELTMLFFRNTPEEKHLFELLLLAHAEGYYNHNFPVTRDESACLTEKILKLAELTVRICNKQIRWYQEQTQF